MHIWCMEEYWLKQEKTKQNSRSFKDLIKKMRYAQEEKNCLKTPYPYTELHFALSNYPELQTAENLMIQNIRSILLT